MKATRRARRNIGGDKAKGPLELLADYRRLLRDTDGELESLGVLLDMVEEQGETLAGVSMAFGSDIPSVANEVAIIRGKHERVGYFQLSADNEIGVIWQISRIKNKHGELDWRGTIHPIWNGAVWNESRQGASVPLVPFGLAPVIAGPAIAARVIEINDKDRPLLPGDSAFLVDYAPQVVLAAWRCVVVMKSYQLVGARDVRIADVMNALRYWDGKFPYRLVFPPESIVWAPKDRERKNPGGAGAPTRELSIDQVRRTLAARTERCSADCPGWAIFEVDREPFMEIEACDECNAIARQTGHPKVWDDDVEILPEAQAELRRQLEVFAEPAFDNYAPETPVPSRGPNKKNPAGGGPPTPAVPRGLWFIIRGRDAGGATYTHRVRGPREAAIARFHRDYPDDTLISITDAMVGQDPPRDNPAMTDEQFVAEIQRLLYDPDPATTDVIQDMLIERGWTLEQLGTSSHNDIDEKLLTAISQHQVEPAMTLGAFEVTKHGEGRPVAHEYDLPAHWASALINGDYTGMDDDEQAEVDRWLERVKPGTATDMGEASFSSRSDHLPGRHYGGDVATYTFLRYDKHPAEGAVWAVMKTSTGKKYVPYTLVSFRGQERLVPAGRRSATPEEASIHGSLLAWRAVTILRANRDADAEFISTELHRNAADNTVHPVPAEIVGGPILTTRGDMPDLKDNPAWVTHTLADAFESLSSQVPPQWLPKLDDVRGGPRATLVATLKEYGCGAYGCVLPTLDRSVVLKVTTDSTEAEFASQLAADLVAPIVVEYYMAVSLAARHEGRPIYLLWREGADDVGKVDQVIGVDAAYYIDEQHKAAQLAYKALRDGSDPKSLLRAWEVACHEMGKAVPELRSLADGLVKIFRAQKIFFGDIHAQNLGRVFRGGEIGEWVVTDPGHVAVL
jgi:hypothetical protein